MKRLIIAIVWTVLLSLPGVSFAEYTMVDTEILCDNYSVMINKLTGDFKESLVCLGSISDEITMAFYANPHTGTWTVIGYDIEQTTACIYVTGKQLRK